MVLSSIAREGKTLHLLPLLTLMREQGPKPNVVVYNIILDGLRRAGQYSRMPACVPRPISFLSTSYNERCRIYEMMQTDRIEPTAATYTVMGRCWVHDKKFDTLIEVMNKPVRALCALVISAEVFFSGLVPRPQVLRVDTAGTKAIRASIELTLPFVKAMSELNTPREVVLSTLGELKVQSLYLIRTHFAPGPEPSCERSSNKSRARCSSRPRANG